MLKKLLNWNTFLTAGLILSAFASLSHGPTVSAAGHSITGIGLNPSTPNVLVNGQNVEISFSYSTTQPGGVLIWARPFVGSSLAPEYAASPAGISPTGSGTGTQRFTISTGNVSVDRIRFQMWDKGQTELLFEAFIPVSYEFRAP